MVENTSIPDSVWMCPLSPGWTATNILLFLQDSQGEHVL